jgi:hypothetical protein
MKWTIGANTHVRRISSQVLLAKSYQMSCGLNPWFPCRSHFEWDKILLIIMHLKQLYIIIDGQIYVGFRLRHFLFSVGKDKLKIYYMYWFKPVRCNLAFTKSFKLPLEIFVKSTMYMYTWISKMLICRQKPMYIEYNVSILFLNSTRINSFSAEHELQSRNSALLYSFMPCRALWRPQKLN